MRGERQQEDPWNMGRVVGSQLKLRKLKSHLPRDAVEDLAREVLRRLADHDEAVAADHPSDDQIEHFCFALISEDDQAGATFIDGARSAGASMESIYLKYLACAARKLGDWWEGDLVSFAEVTIGTSRMYAIMRAIRHQFPVPTASDDKAAIFASVPGETHTLGIQMATDLLRGEGWRIELKVGETHDQLLSGIERSSSGIIGLSAAGEHALAALTKLVLAIRIRKPGAALFVSGHIVEAEHETLALLDIDGVANDIASAKSLLAALWDQQSNLLH